MFELLATHGRKSGDPAMIDVVGDGRVWFRGKVIDLRTGEPQGRVPGFHPSRDGRYLNYADGALELSHPDGRKVKLPYPMLPQPNWIGRTLVVQDDQQRHRADLAVIDTDTGELRGRLTGLRADANGLKLPHTYDPADGRTIWIGEGVQLRPFDVERMSWGTVVPAPNGRRLLNFVVLPTGHFIAGLRTGDDTGLDAIALLDASGTILKERPGRQMGLVRVGRQIAAFDSGSKKLLMFDEQLAELQSLSFKTDYGVLHSLPSGRELILAAGNGQWHHVGEPGLGRPATQTPKAKKPAAKKRKT